MAYTYNGIQRITFNEMQAIHLNESLVGYLKVYPDDTECYIDSDYSWDEIVKHIECGGEIGYEF